MSKKVRQISDAKKETVNVQNSMFELFSGNQQNPAAASLAKLLSARAPASTKYKIYRMVKTITESAEFKAYVEAVQELVDGFKADQEKLDEKERMPPMIKNIPGMEELVEQDSGLEIEKVQLPVSHLPDNITPGDMMALDWIISFNE